MGDYLVINNRETNSKSLSRILIKAIRDVNSQINSIENSTEKERRYLIPEYYKIDSNDTTFGCGDWIITRKGMALVILYLKNLYEDDELIHKMSIENSISCFVYSNEKIEEIARETKEEVLRCYNYTVDVLTDMILTGAKRVRAY